jgi:hypothetical protein
VTADGAPEAALTAEEREALACPYCGASLRVVSETVGPAYLTYERPESIECDAYSDVHCAATWEPDGTPRDAPEWMRYPDLYSGPARPAPASADEWCRICQRPTSDHDGSIHDARTADMPVPPAPASAATTTETVEFAVRSAHDDGDHIGRVFKSRIAADRSAERLRQIMRGGDAYVHRVASVVILRRTRVSTADVVGEWEEVR